MELLQSCNKSSIWTLMPLPANVDVFIYGDFDRRAYNFPHYLEPDI